MIGILLNWLNLIKQGKHSEFSLEKGEKILIATCSNEAADFIAERLFKIKSLKDKFLRVYSERKEDLRKINMEDVAKEPYKL